MTRDDAVETHLPLRPVEFQILVSLGREPRHGYGILQETRGRGAGAAVPGLATLYRALRRLEERGLVEEAPAPEARQEDERRQVYGLTPLGRRVAAAEVRRLELLVSEARGAALLDAEGPERR